MAWRYDYDRDVECGPRLCFWLDIGGIDIEYLSIHWLCEDHMPVIPLLLFDSGHTKQYNLTKNQSIEPSPESLTPTVQRYKYAQMNEGTDLLGHKTPKT